jgi:putative secretion ATPase (PEP-CTERM system associated)
MYESYFRLHEKPFDLAPNPAYLYSSRTHKQAMTYVNYGMQEQLGFILMTGEAGSGKTTLIRELIRTLSTEVTLARLFHTRGSSEDLIAMINEEFGIDTAGKRKSRMLKDLHAYLVKEYEKGRKPLLIIDDAHNLSLDQLEEVRMLSNFETDTAKLLQIILIGQPELGTVLSLEEMRPFRQRVGIVCQIHPLTRQETEEYVLHRLSVAGNREALSFQDGAFDAIHETAAGIPRQINTLCNFLLLTSYTEERRDITAELVRDVAEGLEFTTGQGGSAATGLPASGNGDLAKKRARLQALGIIAKDEAGSVPAASGGDRTTSLNEYPLSIRSIGLRLQIGEKEPTQSGNNDLTTLKQRIDSLEAQIKASQAIPSLVQEAAAHIGNNDYTTVKQRIDSLEAQIKASQAIPSLIQEAAAHIGNNDYATLKQRIDSFEAQIKALQTIPHPVLQVEAEPSKEPRPDGQDRTQDRREEGSLAASPAGRKPASGERRKGRGDRRKSPAS